MMKKRKDNNIYTMEENEYVLKKRRTRHIKYFNLYLMKNEVLYVIACLESNLNELLNKVICLIKDEVSLQAFDFFIDNRQTRTYTDEVHKTYPNSKCVNFNKQKSRITNRQIIIKGNNIEMLENYMMIKELKK